LLPLRGDEGEPDQLTGENAREKKIEATARSLGAARGGTRGAEGDARVRRVKCGIREKFKKTPKARSNGEVKKGGNGKEGEALKKSGSG